MLSRRALATVLQSLVTTELVTARGRGNPDARLPADLPNIWPETMRLNDGTGLGCDSLERMWLAAAVNEMFNLHEAGGEVGLLTGATFGSWIDCVQAGWRSGTDRITLTTSGTTGRPKRCTHDAAHLLVEAEALGDLFHDRRRVVTLVPAHHAYGFLFCALLPDALAVDRLDATSLGPGKLARALAPGDLVVTFPERWSWLERSLPQWPDDVEGVVSTAPCPPNLIAALHDRGLSAMTEVYGSTETAGVAVRRWPESSYRLMAHWQFGGPAGQEGSTIVHRSGRRFELPDDVQVQDGGRFKLTGRRDGAVQIGGVNIYPNEVAAWLRGRPGVREAVVRLMRPEEGGRLKAFVVPEAGVDPTALRKDLQAWTRRALPSAACPTAITMGPRLPTGMTGKLADW